MTITINGSGTIVGSDRAEAGVNDDITGLQNISSINGGQLAGVRNRIINGKMEIAQRGTSFNISVAGTYTLDRFVLFIGGGGLCNVAQSTSVPSLEFRSSLLVSVTTADVVLGVSDNCTISQRIEGYNVRDLIGRPFTLSFWVRSAKVGTHCVAFRGAQAQRSFITEYTIAVANTWEFKKITITSGLITDGSWEWTNGAGLLVDWTMASGSGFNTTPNAWQTGNFLATANQVNVFDTVGNTFAIAGVQLEVGPVATPFEHRPYGMELALCQRYFYRTAGSPQHATIGVGCSNGPTTASQIGMIHPTPMRAIPTLSAVNIRAYNGIVNNPAAISNQNSSSTHMTFNLTTTGMGTSQPIAAIALVDGYLDVNAEL